MKYLDPDTLNKIAIEVSLHAPLVKSPLHYDANMLEHRAELERELAELPKGRTWVLPHDPPSMPKG